MSACPCFVWPLGVGLYLYLASPECVREIQIPWGLVQGSGRGVPPGPRVWRASGLGISQGLERLDSREASCPLLFLLAGLWG